MQSVHRDEVEAAPHQFEFGWLIELQEIHHFLSQGILLREGPLNRGNSLGLLDKVIERVEVIKSYAFESLQLSKPSQEVFDRLHI